MLVLSIDPSVNMFLKCVCKWTSHTYMCMYHILCYHILGVQTATKNISKGVQGQWAWSQMGVHDVRVTVLDLPLVSGVQGEGGMGALHCPTCMRAPPVMFFGVMLQNWTKISQKKPPLQNVSKPSHMM